MKAVFKYVFNRISYDQLGVLIGYLRTSGWFRSFRSGHPVDVRGGALPWYSYPALHFLEHRLAALGSRALNVFEFGSGNSTLWWANHANQLVSVEDNRAWYESISKELPDNVKHIFAAGEDAYIDALRTASGPFDVIVIDGSHRPRCIVESISHLSDRGILIIDNSDWPSLASAINSVMQQGFRRLEFYGLGPVNGYPWSTSILYRHANIFGI